MRGLPISTVDKHDHELAVELLIADQPLRGGNDDEIADPEERLALPDAYRDRYERVAAASPAIEMDRFERPKAVDYRTRTEAAARLLTDVLHAAGVSRDSISERFPGAMITGMTAGLNTPLTRLPPSITIEPGPHDFSAIRDWIAERLGDKAKLISIFDKAKACCHTGCVGCFGGRNSDPSIRATWLPDATLSDVEDILAMKYG